MISHVYGLDRKIKESNIEEIYERLCIPKDDQPFAEILAEFGIELTSNAIFEPYIKNIADKENQYRQQPNIASILQKATYTPAGQQELDQEMLKRKERISEYFSLWSIIRSSKLYNISSHKQVRLELIAKNDLRDLADFEEGIIVFSDILNGNINPNLADSYLSYAHRVLCGIIQFSNKQQTIVEQPQNINEKTLSHSKSSNVNKREVTIIFDNDTIELSSIDKKLPPIKKYDNKKKQDNLRFKLLLSLHNHHPQGISKKQLKDILKKEYGQINRARRGINDQVYQELGYDDLIKRDRRTGRMTFNDKYNVVFQ